MLNWTPKSDPVLSIFYQTIENGVRSIKDWEEDPSIRTPPQQVISLRTASPAETSTPARNATPVVTPSPVTNISLDDSPFPIETLMPAKFSNLAGDHGHDKPLKNAMSHMFSVGRDSNPLYQNAPPPSYDEEDPTMHYSLEAFMGASIMDKNKGGDDDGDDDTRSLLSVY